MGALTAFLVNSTSRSPLARFARSGQRHGIVSRRPEHLRGCGARRVSSAPCSGHQRPRHPEAVRIATPRNPSGSPSIRGNTLGRALLRGSTPRWFGQAISPTVQYVLRLRLRSIHRCAAISRLTTMRSACFGTKRMGAVVPKPRTSSAPQTSWSTLESEITATAVVRLPPSPPNLPSAPRYLLRMRCRLIGSIGTPSSSWNLSLERRSSSNDTTVPPWLRRSSTNMGTSTSSR